MNNSEKTLLISGVFSSLLFFAISSLIGGRKLIKTIFILPDDGKLLFLTFALGFFSALSLFLLYETSSKIKKYFPEEIFFIIKNTKLPVWLFVMTIASLSEEVLFRGALQQHLGILFTNLIFGFMHYLAEERFILMGFFAFIFGILISFVYKWTGILAYPVVVHLSHNLFSTIFLRLKKN